MLKKFIELAEGKVQEAQKKAAEVQSGIEASDESTTNIEDLEATETPETLLLATVSGEQSKDRTDRAIITPWLKFLWETYRTVLEILKNNSRLEIMYQSTAHQAFDFCLRYTRKTEFRRLCELLRNHVQNAHKYSSQMHAINLNEPETLQRHLETRFRQLNVADELELWQEAFRSVEDIHMLMTLSKRPAKSVMMANYYEKLTKIFLVSDNFLFHAAAYNRYFNLLRQSSTAVASGHATRRDHPSVTEEALTKYASFVVLSALAIPVISTSRSRGALVDMDEARKNKNTRLTNLLSMPAAPTRSGLFKDIISKGLLQKVRPEIKELYNILEVHFHPLSICKKISPILVKIGEDSDMSRYVVPLQQVILTRLFQQLSQVYESVDLKFVTKLAQFPEPFQVTPGMIEKFIMNGCKKGDLAIRLDHVSGNLTFDSDVFSSAKALHGGSAAGSAESDAGSIQRLQNTPAEIARSQLARLAKTLHVTCMYVDPSYNQLRVEAHNNALARAEAEAEQEHQDNLARRGIIEKRKEAASQAQVKKAKEEDDARRRRQQELVEAEARRLREETRARELKRVRDEQQRIKRQEVEKQLNELKGGMKLDLEGIEIDDLDTNAIRNLKLSQLEKDKKKKDGVVATTAKRMDHLERAFRREELKHLDEDYQKQRDHDLKVYEKNKELMLEESQAHYKESITLKRRLGRLVGQYDEFKSNISSRRHKEFEKLRQKADREFEEEKKKRVRAHMEEKARQQRLKDEAERRQREEEERLEREAAEAAAKEEEKKRQLEERRKRAEADRAERDEAARKQREREEEAEQRRLARKAEQTGATRPEPFAARRREAPAMEERTASSEGRTAPRLNIGGRTGGMSWREREAAKAQQIATAVPSADQPSQDAPAVQEPPAQRRGYIPPALRDGARPKSEAPPVRDESPANGERRAGYRPSQMKDEGRQSSRDADTPPAMPRKTGGYVPPHLRNKQ